MSVKVEAQTAEDSAFFANNDASSYNTRYIKSIRNKERFQELHFYRCSVDLIDELFPRVSGKGTYDPPAAYRASAVALVEWRELDQAEQLRVISAEKHEGEVEGPTAKYELAAEEQPKRSLGTQDVNTSVEGPASKVQKIEQPAAEEQPAVEEQPKRSLDFPDQWDIAALGTDIDFCGDRICRGITLNFLKQAFPGEHSKLAGFGSVAGEAMKYKALCYTGGHSWPFASDPTIAGAIVEQLSAENGTVIIFLKWICVIHAETSEGEASNNSNKLDSVHFHHPSCDRSSANVLCENCKLGGKGLVQLCGETGRKQ